MRRIALTAVIALCAAMISAEPIALMWNARPPYMSAKGDSVDGLTARIAIAALKKAGIEFVTQETPSARQIEDIKKNSSALMGLGWFKNPEREGFAQFSVPIYQDKPSVVVTRKENAVVPGIKKLDALLGNKSVKLLVKTGYSYGAFLDKKIAELKPTVETTNVESTNMIKMIKAGNADYMFMSSEEAEVLITAAGLKYADFTVSALDDIPPGEKRYLMCTKMIPAATMQKLNAAIEAVLKENGMGIK